MSNECGRYGCKGEMTEQEVQMFDGLLYQMECPICHHRSYRFTAEQVKVFFPEGYLVESWHRRIFVSKDNQKVEMKLSYDQFNEHPKIKIEAWVTTHPEKGYDEHKTLSFKSFPKAARKIVKFIDTNIKNRPIREELEVLMKVKEKNDHDDLMKVFGLDVMSHSMGVGLGNSHRMAIEKIENNERQGCDISTKNGNHFLFAMTIDRDTAIQFVKILKEKGFKDALYEKDEDVVAEAKTEVSQ